MFFKGSRYQNVGSAQMNDGTRVVFYKKTRFVRPLRADLAHRVLQGERLDGIAYIHFRDPERFWRICDVNEAMWPDDLITEPGKTILIPPSEG